MTLILEINEKIRHEGYCVLKDHRMELIFDHASDMGLKIQRLHSFARLHHWHVKVQNHGHSALFYAWHGTAPGGNMRSVSKASQVADLKLRRVPEGRLGQHGVN